MRLRTGWKVTLTMFIAGIGVGQALACQCGASSRLVSDWRRAQLEADGAAVIFDGTAEKFEVGWDLIQAKEGEWVAADLAARKPGDGPDMIVTFRVRRVYKGYLGQE